MVEFLIVSCYCVFSFPQRFVVKHCMASWKADRETEFRECNRSSLNKNQVNDRCLSLVQQTGSAATRMVLLSTQLSAVLQLLYLPHQIGAALYKTHCSTTATVPAHQIGAALYTTLCSTTATVPSPPDRCCFLYNCLQYYSYCPCPTRLVLPSIQLSAVLQLLHLLHHTGAAFFTTSAVLQLLYLPHHTGAALYTTLCSTTATVPAPQDWCCSLYNSLQYYSNCTCPTTLVLLSIQLSAVLQLLYLPHPTLICSVPVPAPSTRSLAHLLLSGTTTTGNLMLEWRRVLTSESKWPFDVRILCVRHMGSGILRTLMCHHITHCDVSPYKALWCVTILGKLSTY